MKIKRKRCPKCGKTKTASVSDFYRSTSNTDGLATQCRACSKVYRDANTERIAATGKRFYAANKERVLAAGKRFHEANPEYSREYRQANKEKIRARDRKYSQERRRAAKTDYTIRAGIMLTDARSREGERGEPVWTRIDTKLWTPVVAAELVRLEKLGEIKMDAPRRDRGLSPSLSRIDNLYPFYTNGFVVECMRLNKLRGDTELTPEVIARVNQASRLFFKHDAAHLPLELPTK